MCKFEFHFDASRRDVENFLTFSFSGARVERKRGPNDETRLVTSGISLQDSVTQDVIQSWVYQICSSEQCDQIGQFIGLWTAFQNLWQ